MTKQEFLKNYTFLTYQEVDEKENYGMSHFVLILDNLGTIIPFKYIKSKEGGMYYADPTFNYKLNGKNEFVKLIDSTSKRLWLIEFVKENVQMLKGNSQPIAMSASLGIAQPQTQPKTQGGAATDEQCPF